MINYPDQDENLSGRRAVEHRANVTLARVRVLTKAANDALWSLESALKDVRNAYEAKRIEAALAILGEKTAAVETFLTARNAEILVARNRPELIRIEQRADLVAQTDRAQDVVPWAATLQAI